MTAKDTFQVVLWNGNGRGYVERVLDTFVGGTEAREDAVRLAFRLSELKEQLIMLGVAFSAPYEVRVKQERRVEGAFGLSKRTRWLGVDAGEPDPAEEARFWGDELPARPELPAAEPADPTADVQRTIDQGAARLEPHIFVPVEPHSSLCGHCDLISSDPIHVTPPMSYGYGAVKAHGPGAGFEPAGSAGD